MIVPRSDGTACPPPVAERLEQFFTTSTRWTTRIPAAVSMAAHAGQRRRTGRSEGADAVTADQRLLTDHQWP